MRFWVNLLSIGFLLAIAGIVALIFAFVYFSKDLPDSSSLKDYQPPILTRLHAGDGRFMAEYAAEKRLFVPYTAMPPLVINAFLSAEDKDYFKHQGVDFASIVRAMLTNLKQIGSDRRPIGASTITQQVARNFFLTNEVSYMRKIREILLAFRIEHTLSKEQILELYLNQIFLGERSYGVAAAALNYFNRSLDELTVAQAAFLAALPKAPNNYHPVRDRAAAVGRRNWVIERMREDGHINAEQAMAAQAETLEMTRRGADQEVQAEYFAEEVRRELVGKFGDAAVLEGGLYVRTSVDPQLQAAATRALRNGLIDYDRRRGYRGPVTRLASMQNWPAPLQAIAQPAGSEGWLLAAVSRVTEKEVQIQLSEGEGRITRESMRWADNRRLTRGDVILVAPAASGLDVYTLEQIPQVQGALVALDPHTGRVLAMVGGFSSRISVFNRATQAKRQPGSAFKPFVYLAALDQGFTPASLVMDAPFAYQQGPGLPLWQPENYSEQFYGPTPLRVGMEKSRNVMTVRLAHAAGMDKIKATAEKFGIVENMPLFLSMSLGSIETTPMQLTAAYAMLVNGGKKIMPSFIDLVMNRTGQVIWQHDVRRCTRCADLAWVAGARAPVLPDVREQIQDPRTAYQMVSMLEGVVQRGTAAKLKADLPFPVAGKTGTTNDARDAWFVGFTPDLTVGVYVGFDEPRSLGNRETGGSVAVPIFGEFMQAAMQDKPAIPFRVPAGLRMMRVDPNSGQLAAPGTAGAIWEAFLPGTDPVSKPQAVLDGTNAEGLLVDSAASAMPTEAGDFTTMPDRSGPVLDAPQLGLPPALPKPPANQLDGLY